MTAALTFPHVAPPAPGAFIDIAPGIKWIRMPLPFALDHINLWLLDEPATEDDPRDGWTVVDTGFGVDVRTSLGVQSHLSSPSRSDGEVARRSFAP